MGKVERKFATRLQRANKRKDKATAKAVVLLSIVIMMVTVGKAVAEVL